MRRTDDVRQLIARLGLEPHPEGGHFREVYRHRHDRGDKRGHVTSIYYLLEAGQVSHWHRIDAVELWHFHAGAPLELTVVEEGGAPIRYRLGIDLDADEQPQATVPPKAWAERPIAGRLVPGWLHCRPGIRFRRLRAGGAWLVTLGLKRQAVLSSPSARKASLT
jgi:predicted cupin superfamily sugar epimerase